MTPKRQVRIGTRGSDLALWQSNHVAGLIRATYQAIETELIIMKTQGDLVSEVPLWTVEGKAFFTKELDEALLKGAIDIAVHSLKDLATEPEQGLATGAVLEREDPRDALISKDGHSFDQLPAGSRIGTSSLRRRAFIARQRPDLELTHLRGNVPTRVEKVQRGDIDAIVLAVAGLRRLGLADTITSYMPLDTFPPAPGQGAVAVTLREEDDATATLLKGIDHAPSHRATSAERAVLSRLEGGCHTPLGAYAVEHDGLLKLHAVLSDPDGTRHTETTVEGDASAPVELGHKAADHLLREFGPVVALTDRPQGPSV